MVPEDVVDLAKILVVDDEPDILSLYELVLGSAGYGRVVTARDPRGVLALLVEYGPDLLILDIEMPYLNGLDLLEILQESQPGLPLPILVVTALATAENRCKALRAGAIDVLSKPFDTRELPLRVRNLLKIRLALREAQEQNRALFAELLNRTEQLSTYQLELKEAQLEVIARLARAGEKHDDDTGQHTQRVAVTAGLLAQHLGAGTDEVHVIQRAAPLHDVGKIGVPDSILLKPGGLTQDEYRIMQRHCRVGAELLSSGRSEIVRAAERIALTHHERWDGRGYPCSLEAVEIPLQGRIVAVADVFDALTHDRPYKTAWPLERALDEIRLQAGRQFDPEVVEAFLQLPHSELV